MKAFRVIDPRRAPSIGYAFTPSSMKVFACATDAQNRGLNSFLRGSCDFYGLDLTVALHAGRWTSHRLKDDYLNAFLLHLDPREIVLFTDAYDTVFLAEEAEIVAKYRASGFPVVFTAERNCWPCRELAEHYPSSPTAFRYLNSGGFMGEARELRRLLQIVRGKSSALSQLLLSRGSTSRLIGDFDSFPWSNQYLWSQVYLGLRDRIVLDYRAEIFLEFSTGLTPDMVADFKAKQEEAEIYREEVGRLSRSCQIEDGRVFHVPTQSRPCHMHFNGPVVKRILYNNMFAEVMPWLSLT